MPKTSAQKELEKHWAKQARDAQKRQKQKPAHPPAPENEGPKKEEPSSKKRG